MKLRVDQLAESLRKGLAPVYLISGDEPLQLGEAGDAIREAARGRGFLVRELFEIEPKFDWSRLQEACESYSLFGDRRIIELRFVAKPDKEGGIALRRYAERIPEDAVLLVALPKLTADEQKKADWFKALEAQGVFVQVWPLEDQALIAWLDQRMASKGMLADRSSLGILAARVEGNLLAAAQEIEKLHILFGSVRIDDETMRTAVADSARYDVYDLADAVMQGQVVRSNRILGGLRGEGVAPAVALWALTREIRTLAALADRLSKGEARDAVFARLRIWDKRKGTFAKAQQRLSTSALRHALLRCAQVDRIVKGMEPGEPWEALLGVCLYLIEPRSSSLGLAPTR